MFETIISSVDGTSFTLVNTLIIIITSAILGFAISSTYLKTSNKNENKANFAVTLIMLPAIMAIIILLIGNNVARAFSLAGAFSIVRFRSAPGEPKDIGYVFFTLAVGLSCGMGYLGYAILFTAILSAVMITLDTLNYAVPKDKFIQLKITVPEDLNYENEFENILNQYTSSYSLRKIKTRDFGALFELNYMIQMKPGADQKQFIDELRCKNGNLNIILTLAGFDGEFQS